MKTIHTSAIVLAFLLLQNAEAEVNQSPKVDLRGDLNATVPVSLPSGDGVKAGNALYASANPELNSIAQEAPVTPAAPEAPVAPPPPTAPSVIKKEPLDVNVFTANVIKDAKQFAVENGLDLIFRILNSYLCGNLEVLRSSLNTAQKELESLRTKLAETSLEEAKFAEIFKNIGSTLKELKSVTNTLGQMNTEKILTLKNQIEDLAVQYYTEVGRDENKSKVIRESDKLKRGEKLIDKTVQLVAFFNDIAFFANQPKEPAFSEKDVRKALNVAAIVPSISNFLQASSKEDKKEDKNFVTFPSGDVITGEDLLLKIQNSVKNNELEFLSTVIKLLENKLTVISGSKEFEALIKKICATKNDIAVAKNVFASIDASKEPHNEAVLKTPSVKALLPENLPASSIQPARQSLVGKILVENVIPGYVKSLTATQDPSLNEKLSKLIDENAKITVGSQRASRSKKNIPTAKALDSALVLTNEGNKIDTSSVNNAVFVSQLQKNLDANLQDLGNVPQEIGKIRPVLEDIKEVNKSVNENGAVIYANKILTSYINVNPNFSEQDGKIYIDISADNLSEKNIPTILTSLAMNCDKLMVASLPLLPGLSGVDKAWILQLSEKFSNVLGRMLNEIAKLNGNNQFAETLEPYKALKKSIDEAIDRAKALEEESKAEASIVVDEKAEDKTEISVIEDRTSDSSKKSEEIVVPAAEVKEGVTANSALDTYSEKTVTPATSTSTTAEANTLTESESSKTGALAEAETASIGETKAETATIAETTEPSVIESSRAEGSITPNAKTETVATEKTTEKTPVRRATISEPAETGIASTGDTGAEATTIEKATEAPIRRATISEPAEAETASTSDTGVETADVNTVNKTPVRKALVIESSKAEEATNSESRRKVQSTRKSNRVADLIRGYEKRNKEAEELDKIGMSQRGYGKSRLGTRTLSGTARNR